MMRNRLAFTAATMLLTGLAWSLVPRDARAADPQGKDKDDDGWMALFDGKSMDGWEVVEFPGRKTKWDVVDGMLSGSGEASMLVCTKGPYKNFRFRAEIKINDKGNSGMYFRSTRKPGFTDGVEVQINSSHSDPIRSGSLYGMVHVYKQHVPPDTWFTQEVEVRDGMWRGKAVTFMTVRINGNELYQYLDFERQFKDGYFAFQQHDPGSKVLIRKAEVLPLADKK